MGEKKGVKQETLRGLIKVKTEGNLYYEVKESQGNCCVPDAQATSIISLRQKRKLYVYFIQYFYIYAVRGTGLICVYSSTFVSL